MTYYIGIDPGATGSVVVLDALGLIVDSVSFKSSETAWIGDLRGLLERWIPRPTEIFVESVHSRPGQGSTSMFEFGRSYGMILGLCHGLDVSYNLLSPKLWQKLAWHDGPLDDPWSAIYLDDPKKRSLASAFHFWGKERFQGPKGGTDMGLVDGALIARAGLLKSGMSIRGSEVSEKGVDLVRRIKKDRKKEAIGKAKRRKKREASK